jgi:hypothetical protein
VVYAANVDVRHGAYKLQMIAKVVTNQR